MDSLTLKTEALAWLRFTKRMQYICTEAGYWNADVMGCDNDSSVEIEVKVSATDLRREFTAKKHKHSYYNTCANGGNCPTYFYLYVPKELEKLALSQIEIHQPKAGLIVFSPVSMDLGYRDGKRSEVVRKPKKLHTEKPSESFKRELLLRMGSELVARHVAWRDFSFEIRDNLQVVSNKISETIKDTLNFNSLSEPHDDTEDPKTSRDFKESV